MDGSNDVSRGHFSIDLNAELAEPLGSPDDCITRYRGDVWLHTDDGASQVGRFVVAELDFDQSEYWPQEVLDYQPDTRLYRGLYDATDLHPKVLKLLGEAPHAHVSKNTLLIERFEFVPEVRGTGLSKKVLNHLIERFGRYCRIAALLPYPLQFSIGDTGDEFSKRMRYDDFAGDVESGERKLRKFYKSVGFVRVPGTDLMIRDLAQD